MSKQIWFDCNGVELHDGDTVRDITTRKTETVYACHPEGRPDELSLGLSATSEAFLKRHPECNREIYPFDQFEYYLKPGGRRCLTEYQKVV